MKAFDYIDNTLKVEEICPLACAQDIINNWTMIKSVYSVTYLTCGVPDLEFDPLSLSHLQGLASTNCCELFYHTMFKHLIGFKLLISFLKKGQFANQIKSNTFIHEKTVYFFNRNELWSLLHSPQCPKLLNEIKSNLKYGQNLTVNLTENRNRVKIWGQIFDRISKKS